MAADDSDGWASRMTATFAKEMRRRREERGWSAQKLADACANHGYPIERNVLAKIEGGYRKYVTVTEWLAISQALEVAPVLMIAPTDHAVSVEILPASHVPAWSALEWVTGEKDGRDSDTDASRMMLYKYREYVAALRRERRLHEDATRFADSDSAQGEYYRQLKGAQQLQAKLRDELAKFFGVSDPSVPEDLAYLLEEPN